MKADPKDLFVRAHELGADARETFLQEACGDDAELRLEVQRLLVKAERVDSFFANDEGSTIGADTFDATYAEAEGDVVGPYILRQQIGEGGFGTVWMAEQSVPISRMVALKVVKAGMDTRQVLARFEAERQALAMMDHPNIARVLEAGATASGRPYFAMELVRGIPITRFCDEQKFGVRRRLELFKDVCSAVNHAHQKGVIHRDIKPSNVMVTLAADVPVVKVIDFGIAKATHSRLTEKTLFTRFEQFLGTPAYMSPEQAALSALDIDTRSDIYSLGVLLYELLAGTPPFDHKSLLSAGYDEMRRMIKEDEPPMPSTRLFDTQLRAATSGAGSKQQISPSALKGELDWIVMKAIEKDRGRRYETANAFALDIKRFLADEPISAGAPSLLHRWRKFARRHKLAFGMAGAIAAALVLGLGIAILSYSRERAARSEAERQRAEATEARNVADRKSREARLAQTTAEEQTRVAVSLQEAYRRQVYQSDMHLASLAHEAGNITYLNELLDRHLPQSGDTRDLRGFEWYHWWQTAHAEVARTPVGRPIHYFDISPDYRHSAAVVWELGTLVRSTAASQPVISELRATNCLAFSPDGERLILGGNPLSIFDTSTWRSQEFAVPEGHNATCLAFAPGQPRMASAGGRAGVVLWDTGIWEPIGEPLPDDGIVHSLAFTRDGSRLITAMEDSRAVVWDLATRAVVRTLIGHGKSVRSVVHSPVDDLFATGSSDETVRLWNGKFELLGTYEASAPISVLRFSPDGKKLVGGTSDNNSLLVWNVERHPPQLDLTHVIKGHSRRITGLAFLSDDGNIVMSVSDDGSSKTWDLARSGPSFRLGKVSMRTPAWSDPARLTFSGDGKEILITDPDANRYALDIDSRESRALAHPEGFRTLAVSKDGDWQAGIAGDGHLAAWNVREGNLQARHATLEADVRVNSVVVFSDGPTVTWKERSSGIQFVWNLRDDTTRSFGNAMAGLADLSPRGDRMAAYRWDTTSLWDMTVDPPSVVWESRGWGPEFCAVFSPGADLVASASHNGQIRLVDAKSGNLVHKLTGHTDAVHSLGFSRDGSWLVSGGQDSTVRIWDVGSGQLLSTFANPDGPVAAVAISPAEDSIASLTGDGLLRLWTIATPEEVSGHGSHWTERLNICLTQGRRDEALAILDEAQRDNPDSPILHLTRSRVLEATGDLAGAFSAITRATAFAPTDVNLYTNRARLGVLTGQLSDAADSLRLILKLSPEEETDWMSAAALLIATERLDEYHQLCADMLQRFRNAKAQEVAERVGKTCLIVPPVDSNLAAAVEAAMKSVADPDHWVMPYGLMVRGLAEYRTGNFQGARNWSQRALENPVAWHLEVNGSLVLAMSEWRLGQPHVAKAALDRAIAILDAQEAIYNGGRMGEEWHDWFFSQALRREAEALVNAGP